MRQVHQYGPAVHAMYCQRLDSQALGMGVVPLGRFPAQIEYILLPLMTVVIATLQFAIAIIIEQGNYMGQGILLARALQR